MNIFYSELARFWPLVSPVEEYEDEAHEIRRIIEEVRPGARTVLELGSGGGSNAYHLKDRFSMTLSDLSADMIAMSARINPECEHIVGDMRSLDLGRTFDVVFAHDAVDYMRTETDLAAALCTAHRHLDAGGLAVFLPDHVRERYAPATDSGGSDGPDGRAIRYLEWTLEPSTTETTGVTHYSFLVRDADGSVRCLHEEHVLGLFEQATWERLFRESGFEVTVIEERTEEERVPRLVFLGRRT